MSQSPAYPHLMYLPDYCPVPLAKHLRDSQSVSPPGLPTMSLPTSPTPSFDDVVLPPQTHIRRPPNAFMIYRSELIKSGTIPAMVEHRQQNISRLAGECWNLLGDEDKEVYHEKAREALAKHNLDHPGYKFKPAPRGSKRLKAKAQADPATDAERIKHIREKYCKIVGPSTVAQRKRKRKAKDHRVSEGETSRVHQQQQGPSRHPSPLSPTLNINPGLSFSGPSTPESHGPTTPVISVAGGSNQDNIQIHQPMPCFFSPPPASTLAEALLPRRPSTTALEKPSAPRPPFLNFPYSVQNTTVLTSRPLPLHNPAFLHGFDLNAGPAPSGRALQAVFNTPPDQAVYGDILSGYLSYPDFGSSAPVIPELLGMAGFNQQQQQAVEEASLGGSHGVAPLGLHVRSLSDSVCPLDTTGIQHGAHAASAFDWGIDSYDGMMVGGFAALMASASDSASDSSSPASPAGSSPV